MNRLLYGSDPYERNSVREVEVTVTLTLTKTLNVLVDDYTVIKDGDEEGNYTTYDYSNCDLYSAIKDSVVLPNELGDYTEEMFKKHSTLKEVDIPKRLKDAINDSKDWEVEDIDITL